MGGLGSGRWREHRKAKTVEDCRVLDLGKLAREGCLVAGYRGSVRWLQGDKETASLSFLVGSVDDRLVLTLTYAWRPLDGEVQEVEEHVLLERTPMRFGGFRLWACCPIVVAGRSCLRRVWKLYMPPGVGYFGCRRCNRLTYRSVQEHDKRVDFLRRNPKALAATMHDRTLKGLNLAFKALRSRRRLP
jgi:hypothetical protein